MASAGYLHHAYQIICSLPAFPFFIRAEDGIRYYKVTGVQTCALPIIGVPLAELTIVSSMSTGDWKYPRPRIMYSAPPNSIKRALVSLLPPFTASTTRERGVPYERRRFGSTLIWYCGENPPRDATSATPGTAFK